MLNNSYQAPSLQKITNFTSAQYLPSQKQFPNFSLLLRKIKQVKYPTLPFKPVTSIDDFISHTKSLVLEKNLKNVVKSQNQLKFIRKVRGDGNCFIRAVAFQFLSQINSTKLQKCFPYLESVLLTISDKQYVPKNFKEFYDDDFLSYCLKQNWEAQYSKSLKKYNNCHRLALAALFAQNPYLDFITVLYMRAVSLLALRKFSSDPEIKGFLQDNDEQKLRNYGNLSDGLSHFLLNKLLSIQLNIYQVRNKQVVKYNYPVFKCEKFMTASLLYHHNHYDLLQKEADLQTEKKTVSLNRKESYYSDLSKERQLVEGQCINCESLKLIDVESCLCEGCYMEYQKAMRQFGANRRKNVQKDDQEQHSNNNQLRISSKPSKKLKTDKHQNQQKKRSKSSKRHKLFSCFR